MKCPRCSYEWDVRQSSCPRCGLHIRASGSPRPAHSQVPMSTPPLNNSIASPPIIDRTAQVRSAYLREPTSNNLTPFPTSFNKLQQSKFPLPSTGELAPNQMISPRPSESDALNVQKAPATLSSSSAGVQADTQPLLSGTLLHRDRYSLQQNLRKQDWSLGIVETMWSAFDTRIANSLVLIYELSMPHNLPNEVQVLPYTATKAFTSIGRNTHVLPLRNVFRDKGRSFFVFESIDGVSLSTLLFNSGRQLPEKEVITCCLQIVELLDLCSQQSPPLIHGNIRPEYVVRKSIDSQYVLTNFSIALAGGLAQIMADREYLSPTLRTTNTLMRGMTDGRTDLRALLAMAHYAITGYWLAGGETSHTPMMETSSIPRMAIGSDLSPPLQAILLKGLLTPLHQGYQRPAELYQDLLALYRGYERVSLSVLSAMSEKNTQPFIPVVLAEKSEPTDFMVQDQPREELPEQFLLVPAPEELPPLKDAHDIRNAVLWFAGMLFCLVLLVGHSLVWQLFP